MLTRLSLSNLAIIEKAEIDFSEGFNALTGETGAGKSVIINALSLILGARADSSMVRDGEKQAVIEAVFDLQGKSEGVRQLLEDGGLAACEDSQLIIRRIILSSGNGRAFINDSSATAASLRQIGKFLVDIHGPRANQRILEESFQRASLDGYGSIKLDEYGKLWNELQKVRDKIDGLSGKEADPARLETLRYDIEELENAAIDDDDDDISQRHAAAAHAEEIIDCGNQIAAALTGDDGSATDTLAKLRNAFSLLAKRIPEAEKWENDALRISSDLIELSDEISGKISSFDIDEEEFARLDERLGLVNRLKRKYKIIPTGDNPFSRQIAAALSSKKEELSEFENREKILSELQNEEASLRSQAIAAGAKVTKERIRQGALFSKAVTNALKDLGFLQSRFFVKINECEPCSHGCDEVVFMLEPNPGEGARALADIASSGEIARVMLALKSVLAANDDVATLIFDEIDANIGGETGLAVGRKMRNVARGRQVISITHLPQCAVFADNHLKVSKTVTGGRTKTKVEKIEGQERIEEISRMLGGATGSSDVVRAHAKALIAQADNLNK